MQGIRPATEREVADFYLDGQPMLCETARAFFLVKHYELFPTPLHRKRLRLADFDDWENVGDRVGHRLGLHVWHPGH
jgi:hypothetical protein